MKRSTKVVLVVAAVVGLGVLLQGRAAAKAVSLGVPLGTSVKMSFGIQPSCEERAEIGLALARKQCQATESCDPDSVVGEQSRRQLIDLCRRNPTIR
jgi:hypothetical protein